MILGSCNTANYSNNATWNGIPGNVTTIGSNGKSSYYGTYDQDGNVSELLDTKNASGYPKIRGGNYSSSSVGKLVVSSNDFDAKTSYTGFRVAMSNSLTNDGTYVSVGNNSNIGDGSLGVVAFTFFINKYPVTNTEYVAFLNSVGVVRTNTIVQTLYHTNMGNVNYRGGITRSVDGSNYVYSVIANMGNKPVNWISWYEAARYINWLYNDKPSGIPNSNTTEDGVYTLSGTNKPSRNNTDKFWLPNENEWYKSAYYDPTLNSGAGGYWSYATQDNDNPVAIYANSVGDGDPGSAVIDCISPTPTPTISSTSTPTPTPTITITNTQTLTPTNTTTPTPSITQSLTPTNTITPTPTTSITVSITVTPSLTVSNSMSPTNTPTPTITQSNTPTLTPTNTVTPTPSQTTINPIRIGQFIYDSSLYNKNDVILLYKNYKFVGQVASDVSILTGDQAFVPSTPTPTPTVTNTVTPTSSQNSSPTPTVTSTATPTSSQNSSPTPTATSTVTPTPTVTSTVTPTPTVTSTVTPTPTVTSTVTPTPTVTSTVTPTPTTSLTPTPTPNQSTFSDDQLYSSLAFAINGGSGIWYSFGDSPDDHSSAAAMYMSNTNLSHSTAKGYLGTSADYYHIVITNGDNHNYAYWTSIYDIQESNYSSLFGQYDSDSWMDITYYRANNENNNEEYFIIVGDNQDKMLYTKTGYDWSTQQLPAYTNWRKIKAGRLYDHVTSTIKYGCCLFTDATAYYTLTGTQNDFVFTQRSLPVSAANILDVTVNNDDISKFAIILSDNRVVSNINATHSDYVNGTEFAVYNDPSSLPNWLSISWIGSISDINNNVTNVNYYLVIPDSSSGNTGYYTTDFVTFNSITLPTADYTTAKYIRHNTLSDSRIILLTNNQSIYFTSRDITTWTQRTSPVDDWQALV